MRNIEWIFSGIGVLILSAIWAWVRSRRQKEGVITVTLQQPETAQATSDQPPSKAEAFRVRRRIDAGDFFAFAQGNAELRVELLEVRTDDSASPSEPVAIVRFDRVPALRGVRIKELRSQVFQMPKNTEVLDDAAIVTYHVQGRYFWHFLRVDIIHINAHAKWVEFRFSGFSASA